MYLLYLDEFGHAGAWEPASTRRNHHPFFGLAGLVVEGNRWRDLDRGYLRLKRRFYAREIEKAEILKGLRPERFEPKRLRSRRDRRFAGAVLDLVGRCGGRLVACGCQKRADSLGHDDRSLYTTTAQGVLNQYEKILRQSAGTRKGRGVVIMDQRNARLNDVVLASCQSFLFSRGIERIVETPLLVPSEWYHGVQCADSIGRIISAVFRWRYLEEEKYQIAAEMLGETVDGLAAVYGEWSSVWIRQAETEH